MSTTPTTSLNPSAVAPIPATGVRGASAGFEGADPSVQGDPQASASVASSQQLKLIVAKANEGLAYTYTLVDQITGRVVAEIPHQAAEAAAAKPDYTAGGVLDTHA